MRTANPALNDKVFAQARRASSIGQMTIAGTINRTGILFLILFATSLWSWQASLTATSEWGGPMAFQPTPLMWVGLIGGLIAAMATIFKPTWAPWSAPVYAGLEGLLLGALSAGFEAAYPGIVTQAVLGTFGVLAALLVIYRSGLIQVTDNFRMGVAAATGGIFLVYLISFIMGMFGMNVPYIHEGGLIGIGFSLFVIVIAALNLVLDFDFIERGEKQGAPKHMEWFAAFGLMVTLIWLYIEILRLLSKMRQR